MVFSSIIFLFFFLPICLALYFATPRRFRNFILLLLSLFFYAWGEGIFVLLMLCSIAFNYVFGRLIDHFRDSTTLAKLFLFTAVSLNLGLLGIFKYTNFVVENLNAVLSSFSSIESITITPIHLPIGVSFFTFQAISFVVDVYRETATVPRKVTDVGLYIALFPQLIAGPIVRFHDIAEQITRRVVSQERFAYGIRRFVIGLAKKVLIANNMAIVADKVFALDFGQMSTDVAWIGIICYSLQIFFDFAGYSDMAIGLGAMFGFRIPENFNYPYSATSIREFWRRWHISLSTWFRDYLYIPLGGNRKGAFRTYFNLYIVFFLTGLWHGASWTFVIWGFIHGTFIAIERLGLGKLLRRLWAPFRHFYTLLVVIIAWVFFRVETLPQALSYLSAMFAFDLSLPGIKSHLVQYFVDITPLALVAGSILSVPTIIGAKRYLQATSHRYPNFQIIQNGVFPILNFIVMGILLLLSIMELSSGSYNPFIYFRF